MSGKIHPAPPTLDTFWQATQSKHDDGGGSDAERLAALIKAEARLNIRLPPLLRALYARRNGGYTRYSLAPADPTYKHSEEGWAQLPDRCLHRLDEFTTVGEMSDSCDFGIGPDGVHDSQSWRNLIPGADKLIVIAQHGWDDLLCLDYRSGQAPAVLLLDTVLNPEVALHTPDFAAYFTSLRRELDDG